MSGALPHAVITGGTGTLGAAVAREFGNVGWEVDAPGSAELDVRRPDEIERYFSARRPDLLVCAAGIIRDAPTARLSESAWDEVWEVGFKGARACARAVIPGMAARGGGHVVFISSYSAVAPPQGQSAYATAKAALLGLTRDLARIHGPSNIRVNAILPGFLETRMTAQVTAARRGEVLASHALGRFNTCECVACFIRHLHEHLPHTSGQVFQLDSR
ncbi:MAG TPA: SDR family oxidoreductase [Luteolibacter sp.]|nr:SDR family oxidoreductase [Luteolibacter sp.]